MVFSEFIQTLSSAIRGGNSTAKFTKAIFSAIITDKGQDILDTYQESTYKNFYNGNTSISGISKKLNVYLEPMEFLEYLKEYSDASIEIICDKFHAEIPDISPSNAGYKLGELLVQIITSAASNKSKKNAHKGTKNLDINVFSSPTTESIPTEIAEGVFFIEPTLVDKLGKNLADKGAIHTFKKYLSAATTYCSAKKTLLYTEKPHPFYDLYVCNDIQYRLSLVSFAHDIKAGNIIHNVTVDKLESESKYIIIQGSGGIGKSMLLTHLFLSSANKTDDAERTPFLLSLKDYKDTTCGIVDFIWQSAKTYDSEITQASIITALQQKNLILLLDGFDEIQTSTRDSFDQDLNAFIKSYPGNTIIMTSRPVNSFISYAQFSLFDILELSKEQAIQLIDKLEFWDIEGKNNFLKALDRTLYSTHREFASNPLLLTIMLMTYSSFGEVPAKMHVFYSKAYETMARLHDATKGSFKRPLHTKLTPEEFAKYFSQFCARTYKDEILEFDSMLFNSYMKKVLRCAAPEHQGISPRDFLLDLTNNLCIMYREGEYYYFIHRSFQEYFAAVYFASEYDDKLGKVGGFFDKRKNRAYTDRTFDMLYDMIPEKIERFVFQPYLEDLITTCSKNKDNEYWEFLELMYPYIVYAEGNTGEPFFIEADSFLYRCIVREKKLEETSALYGHTWPNQIHDFPKKVWVEAYTAFLEYGAYDEYKDPERIPDEILDSITIVDEDALPYKYTDYFGYPEQEGISIEIDIYELRKNPHRYSDLIHHMEQPEFPLFREYQKVKNYYQQLKKRTLLEMESDDIFDD